MALNTDIAGIRKDYKLNSFSIEEAFEDPFVQFGKWWNEAAASQIVEYNAMTLCTTDDGGKPSGRIVLLKSFDENGFIFFTNYQSKKAQQIFTNPQVALVFFWKELERQVRIEGVAVKTSEQVSEEYFKMRPRSSQVGAWASPQSKMISDREIINKNMEEYTNKFQDNTIPRPPHWGGYIVVPELIEFWQGRESRLHDRIEYTLSNSLWEKKRLAP